MKWEAPGKYNVECPVAHPLGEGIAECIKSWISVVILLQNYNLQNDHNVD